MSRDTGTAARYTVEGFQSGTWHPILSAEDRETAIRGAGSVAVSGAFDYVRLMLNRGERRELVRIDRRGTVWNGAFVKPLPAAGGAGAGAGAGAPRPPVNAVRRRAPRAPVLATVAAVTLFAVGIAFGRWALQVI